MKKLLLKFTDIVSHGILVSFVVFVLLVATASSLLRHYLPNINEYRGYILEQINARSSAIRIDAEEIRSEWKLFRPEISLYGVSVRSSKLDEDLHLDKLDVKLNFVRSLLTQEIYFDYIELSNLEILLMEDETGQWSFANLKSEDREKQSLASVLNRFWAIDELVLRNVHLSLQPYGKQPLVLPALNAHLSTYRYKKHIQVQLGNKKRQLGELIVKTRHRPSESDFSLQAYLRLDDYAFSELSSLLPSAYAINSGEISSEYWIRWKNDRLVFNGNVGLKNAGMQVNGKSWPLTGLTGKVYGTFEAGKLTIGLPGLTVASAKQRLALSPLKIIYADTLKLQMQDLDLALAYQFIGDFPLSDYLQSVLATLNPRGHLHRVHLQVGEVRPFTLKAELRDVVVDAWAGAPALQPVSGFLYADKQGGYVEFDAQQFSMFFPAIYKKPLDFDKASGYVDWRIGAETIYISGSKIRLEGESGIANGEFAFSLPRVQSPLESPRLSLNIGMKNTAAQYRDMFIPFIVSPGLLQWLKTNIHQGTLPEVGFIFHGPVRKDVAEKKVVQLWLEVNDAVLSFADKWPHIEHINGEFLLDDAYGFARVDEASTQAVAIDKADFRLTPLPDGNAIEIVADVHAPSAQVFRYLQNDALVDKTGPVFSGWKVDRGEAKARVTVNTLLGAGPVSNHVLVDSVLEGTHLELAGQNLKIGNIAGQLVYDTDKGLSSNLLTGIFLGNPVSATIDSLASEGVPETTIRASGDVAVSDLARWSKQPLLDFLQGASRFTADIYFGGETAGLRLTSDLKGISVLLPKPFGKKPATRRDLQINMPFGEGQREVDIFYGEGINAHFLLGGNGPEAGTINLGLNRAEYQKGKIVLGGQVVDVSVEEWMDVIDRYRHMQPVPSTTTTTTTTTSTSTSTSTSRTAADSLVFTVEQLKIRNLQGFGQTLDSVSLDLFNTVSYWQVGLTHSDLQATLRIFENEQPMQLQLHRVNLDFLSKKQQESGVSYASTSWSRFPDIDVVIDKLLSGGEDFGEWEFKLRSYDDYMALEDIQASFKAMRLTDTPNDKANLRWTFGEHPKSHFRGMFVSDNIANALKAWGYKQEVHSEKAEFVVESWWDGVPADFDFDTMQAKTKLSLSKGNFADVSSGSTDALKLIGVFNIANLVKRLQLDFSDLTSTGLSYETVTGVVSTDHGVYHYDQPIEITSSASKIRLYGGFDMNTDQLDMTMGVTLPLASNLPWIVALAAGLPTAAGVYIISKVLDKQVDKISSAVYRVTGPFAEPEIKFDSLFDTEDGFDKKEKQSGQERQPGGEDVAPSEESE